MPIPHPGHFAGTRVAVGGVTTIGIEKAMNRIAAYNMSRAKPTLEKAALAGANVARQWVYDDMAKPKHGRKYARLPRRSSAEGETPAIQFGDLLDSLDTRNEDSGSPYVGRAVFAAGATSENRGFPYAWALEFGGPKLKARPYMRPSVDNNKNAIAAAMVDVVSNEWKAISAKVK